MTIVQPVLDGTTTTTYNNTTYKDGTWKLEANNTVYMECNQKFCEFRGTLHGNVINGESWNVNNLRWKTRLERVLP